MTFFEDRAGAEKVEKLLAKPAESKHPLLMSVVNWGEVYYSVWRAVAAMSPSSGLGIGAEDAAAAKLQEIAQLPIEIVGLDMELAHLAATLKAKHNLPYADCFAAAIAQSKKATLVTADRDFSSGESILRRVWVS